jgi:hypothetical protein
VRVVLSPGNVITVTIMAFLGLVGLVLATKYLAGKSIPVVSNVAAGIDTVWGKAAA